MKYLSRVLLTFVAGFCDTATFIHMHGVFTAHVTGNFVLFAVSLAEGLENPDYLKILTFPVFLIGVVIATMMYGKMVEDKLHHRRLLWWMTGILIGCAVVTNALGYHTGNYDLGWIDIGVTLALVIALAAQNTIHHFIPGPMTTVMTGTVMNTAAGLAEKYLLKHKGQKINTPPPKSGNSLWMVASFAIGCIFAAFLTLQVGLGSIAIPALLMLGVMRLEYKKEKM